MHTWIIVMYVSFCVLNLCVTVVPLLCAPCLLSNFSVISPLLKSQTWSLDKVLLPVLVDYCWLMYAVVMSHISTIICFCQQKMERFMFVVGTRMVSWGSLLRKWTILHFAKCLAFHVRSLRYLVVGTIPWHWLRMALCMYGALMHLDSLECLKCRSRARLQYSCPMKYVCLRSKKIEYVNSKQPWINAWIVLLLLCFSLLFQRFFQFKVHDIAAGLRHSLALTGWFG